MRSEWETLELQDVARFSNERVNVSDLSTETYISTANMLPDKQGIETAESIPNIATTPKFKKKETLVSNIRPYFKKIWYASKDGGCSNDVLVFSKIDDSINSKYLYYLLNDDRFFDYMTATSKGTKMPRGDKSAIMQYKVLRPSLPTQKAIADTLSALDNKIELNNRINKNLEAQAQALFKHWFVDFEFPNENGKPYKSSGGKMVESELGLIPEGWRVKTLNDTCLLNAGGDKPKTVSEIKTDVYSIPIFSNGINNNGLYGYTTEPRISQESVTVSARGTIGFICLREKPYVPIVRLVSVTPKTEELSPKYLYRWLKQSNILGTGTTQQQLTVPDFRNTPIMLPTSSLMKKFTDTAIDLHSLMTHNEQQNQVLAQIRDTLLPKLMSGEIEVPIAE